MDSTSSQKTKKAPKSSKTTRGLGRGLSSLLGDERPEIGDGHKALSDQKEYQTVPVEWINVGPWQPRRHFDRENLEELANSILQKGVVQPILLRPMPNHPNRFQIVAGERRWRAAQIAKLHELIAVVRDLSDAECYEIALIENIQRQDLSVIDEAQGYANLLEVNKCTQDHLSKIIGKSRSHITNLLRLLGLPEEVKTLLREGRLSMGHVRPLVGHPQASSLAEKIASKGLSVRQAEVLSKTVINMSSSTNKNVKSSDKSPDIRKLETLAEEQLGLAISIAWNENTEIGKVQIKCKSLDQMDGVLKQLGLVL